MMNAQKIQPQGPGEGQGQGQGQGMCKVNLSLTMPDENLVANEGRNTGERRTYFYNTVTKETVTWKKPESANIRIVPYAGWVESETYRRKLGQAQGQVKVIEFGTTGKEGSGVEEAGSPPGTSSLGTENPNEGEGGPRLQGQPRMMQGQPRGPDGQPGGGVLQGRGPTGQIQRLRHRGPINKCRMCIAPQMLGMPRHGGPPQQWQPRPSVMLQGHGSPGQIEGQGHPTSMEDRELVDISDSEVGTEGSVSGSEANA